MSNTDSVWATCPLDILITVFKKLNIKSVINCRGVNIFWRDVADYYFEHFKLWPTVIQHTIGEATFTEKSVLEWKDKILSAQSWQDVSKASVSLRHRYKLKDLAENICVYRDNLIVTTNAAVTYYNINNFEVNKTIAFTPLLEYMFAKRQFANEYVDIEILRKFVNTMNTDRDVFHYRRVDMLEMHLENLEIRGQTLCRQEYESSAGSVFRYQETSSLVVELKLTNECSEGFLELTLTNKLYTDPLHSDSVRKLYVKYPVIFRVHLNSCYFISRNVLWMYTAVVNGWDKKWLAHFYGCESLHSIHINRENVYVLLTSGNVLLVDMDYKSLINIFRLTTSLSFMDPTPFMFNTCVLVRTPNSVDSEIRPCKKADLMKCMFRDKVTCVLEHGYAVLIGYEDLKIEIYLHKKLFESEVPELKFSIKDMVHEEMNPKIRALDIYEDDIGHHLFVSSYYYVYELLLSLTEKTCAVERKAEGSGSEPAWRLRRRRSW
ncbi:uncharacterized protein LOC112048586 [Bicyclus anynana]|uniref:Uncharacterized protein LOC112048586 n=1 Tax=Bicyclus anynana TaxID=110368 RepID=A0A6J1N261_BICAN|nr:uncharacterized protein LOC112048586 [Bicyclus anynana]